MKIAFVSQPLDSWEDPLNPLSSIGILTYNFARLLAGRGHEVTIYVNALRRRRSRARNEGNLRVVEIRSFRPAHSAMMRLLRRANAIAQPEMPFLGSCFYDPIYAARVAFDARRRGIEIIHVHNFSQYGEIIKAIYRKAKLILHMHCLWLSNFDGRIIERRLGSFDKIICCSNFIRDAARIAVPTRANAIDTVYNGVDTCRFDGRLHQHVNEDIYYVGRVSPEKGIHLLIEAFKRITQDFPRARLFLVGSTDPLPKSVFATLGRDPILERHAGTYYEGCESPPYLRLLRDQAGAPHDGRVRFLGALCHADLIERLRSAALVVQPSLCGEAFGMPAAEAMAMGLPVVVTRAGGLVEVVEESETGFIVERGRLDGLTAAIMELLRSPERRRAMGCKGRQRALERFAFTGLARQLEDHYRALLTPSGAAPAALRSSPEP